MGNNFAEFWERQCKNCVLPISETFTRTVDEKLKYYLSCSRWEETYLLCLKFQTGTLDNLCAAYKELLQQKPCSNRDDQFVRLTKMEGIARVISKLENLNPEEQLEYVEQKYPEREMA